ncbi:indole-3-glycerol phosphate synthase, partial [Streptomyces sp. t39]
MFTSVLMIEKPLTGDDVEFLTTLHGDEDVSFVVLMQPRG